MTIQERIASNRRIDEEVAPILAEQRKKVAAKAQKKIRTLLNEFDAALKALPDGKGGLPEEFLK